jgi:hypothetical protein
MVRDACCPCAVRPLTFQSLVIPFPSVGEPEIVAKPGSGTLFVVSDETKSSPTRPITRPGFRKSLDKSEGVPPLHKPLLMTPPLQ